MALLYWLPLISDVHNQGLTGATFTNNNVTFGGTGKLGSSAVFNGSSTVIYADGVSVGDAWTACWWAKAAASHNGYMFQLGDAATANQVQAAMRTSNQGGGTDTFLALANKTGPTITVDGMNYLEWNHYALVYDGVDLKIYINGALKYTDTQTRIYYSGTRLSIGNYYSGINFNGMIQDFRLYDTPLSPREIKEISKGLVLHYPLAMPGGANLGLNTGHDWAWSAGTANYAFNRVFVNPSPLEKTTYTVSANVEVTGGSFTKVTVVPYNSGTTASQGTRSDTPIVNGRISTQVTVTGDAAEVVLLYAGVAGATAGNSVIFRNIKIEKGTVATPWIPNSADAEYATLGLNDGIEYDVSGFERNGTKSNMAYSSDTARYNTSSVFNKQTGRVLIPNIWNTSVKNSEITFAFWMKRDDYDDSYAHYMYNDICQIYMQYNDQYAGNGWGLRIAWKHDTASSSNSNTWATGRTIPADEWHHVCFTTKDGIMKLYIDGIMHSVINDRSSTGQYIGSYNFGALGYVSNNDGVMSYGGKLSDFRIYSTALSADDVMELYHTPITLSNNGTLLTQGEYVEV